VLRGATALEFSRLHTSLSRLEPGKEELAGIGKEVEAAFLSIGSVLDKLPDASDRLVRQGERFLVLASGKGEGEALFNGALDVLQPPLAYIGEFQKVTAHQGESLRNCIARIDQILASEAALERTVAPLRFVKTLFKVESATLDGSVQAMFLSLTGEIEQLQRQVAETFAAKFAILRETRRTLDDVETRLRERVGRQSVVLQERHERLRNGLAEMQYELKLTAEQDTSLTRVTREISQQVGCLVMGLQIQDIVSQKIAHVIEAIQAMEVRFRDCGSFNVAPDRSRLARYLNECALVQRAQLAAVEEDLRQGEENLTGALTRIELEASRLEEGCAVLADYKMISSGKDGIVEMLLDALNGIGALVDETVSTAAEAYEAALPVGGKASDVTGPIRKLSAQMHLIAVNSQVHAARVGAGTGLEALAANTAAIASATESISGQIASDLEAIMAGLDRLVREFGEIKGLGVEQQQTLEGRIPERVAALHAYRAAADAEQTKIVDSAQSIQSLTSAMKSKLALTAIGGERIKAARSAFEQVISDSKATIAVAGVVSDSGHEFVRTYTMASEREIHEAALAGRDVGREIKEKPIAPTETGDMEFFADFSAPTAANAADSEIFAERKTSSESSDSPAEEKRNTPNPPQNEAASVSVGTVTAPKEASLGDNVELF
jgi:hypothetical protein